MIKTFCDVCEREITDKHREFHIKARKELFEIKVTNLSLSRDAHIHKPCLIKALEDE